MFTCTRCQAQVLVCKSCERGQRYCSRQCSQQARQESSREAGRRYQDSRAGRLAHARRAKVYRQRQRQKIVTHQGCQAAAADAVLSADLTVKQAAACKPVLPWHCHWCARACQRVVRRDVLPHVPHGRARHLDADRSNSSSHPGAPHGQAP